MTTTIKVTSHNHPARVITLDAVPGEKNEFTVADERILRPEDGEQTFYCTTTRKVEIQDLEYETAQTVAV